jgi:large subunit ribosomal protein L4
MQIDVVDIQGQVVGTTELDETVWGIEPHIAVMHQALVRQQANARLGTSDTKTRAEVRGGGRKPWRQKGTGRARQGSIRAPQYNGGGIVHGPTPRSFDQRTPKKMKAAALRGALSDRARSGRLHVVESLAGGNTPSTKSALSTLRELTERPRVLVVVNTGDTLTVRSLRNVPNVELLPFDQLNTYDVLRSDDLVFTKAAYDAFVQARAGEGVDTITLSKAVTEVEKAPAADAAKSSTAKKPAKKSPAKKAPAADAAKTSSAKKAPAEKAAAKKAPAADAAKTSTAKKTAAKKAPAAKKTPAKKTAAKKTAAKKTTTAKKAPAKKAAKKKTGDDK